MLSYLTSIPFENWSQTHLLHEDFSYLSAKNNIFSYLSEIVLSHLLRLSFDFVHLCLSSARLAIFQETECHDTDDCVWY